MRILDIRIPEGFAARVTRRCAGFEPFYMVCHDGRILRVVRHPDRFERAFFPPEWHNLEDFETLEYLLLKCIPIPELRSSVIEGESRNKIEEC